MELIKFINRKVIIQTFDDKIFRGMINDYIYPEDNENEKESIIIDAIGYDFPYEFYEDDIKSIEIMK